MIILLIFLMLSAGCVRTSVFVLDQAELVRIKKDGKIFYCGQGNTNPFKKGSKLVNPDGITETLWGDGIYCIDCSIIDIKYDGWLLSDRAVDRVMDARIKKINLQ